MTYEETLAALQELLGELVSVLVTIRPEGVIRVVSFTTGRLKRGETIDFADALPPTAILGGDSVAFLIGEGLPRTVFLVTKSAFDIGFRHATESGLRISYVINGGVVVEVARVNVTIASESGG